jgi:hypothetical protein
VSRYEIDEDAVIEAVDFDEETIEEPEPVPVPEPEPTSEMQPDGAITSEDGSEVTAPEGMTFATYTGSADMARLGDIKLEPGVPTLVSKEQSVTLLKHPTEKFRVSDVLSADEE